MKHVLIIIIALLTAMAYPTGAQTLFSDSLNANEEFVSRWFPTSTLPQTAQVWVTVWSTDTTGVDTTGGTPYADTIQVQHYRRPFITSPKYGTGIDSAWQTVAVWSPTSRTSDSATLSGGVSRDTLVVLRPVGASRWAMADFRIEQPELGLRMRLKRAQAKLHDHFIYFTIRRVDWWRK